jgi:hypothetical protein
VSFRSSCLYSSTSTHLLAEIQVLWSCKSNRRLRKNRFDTEQYMNYRQVVIQLKCILLQDKLIYIVYPLLNISLMLLVVQNMINTNLQQAHYKFYIGYNTIHIFQQLRFQNFLQGRKLHIYLKWSATLKVYKLHTHYSLVLNKSNKKHHNLKVDHSF